MTMNGDIHPLSLYIHIPFCRKKCDYCAFYVLPNQTTLIEAFLQPLLDEIAMKAHWVANRPVVSLFFGGGTPSLLPLQALEKIIAALHKHYTFAPNVEWSMEVNPEDVTPHFFPTLYQMGINRISLGVQTFDAQLLKNIGRACQLEDVYNAIKHLQRVPFRSTSLDLMYALPQQSHTMWRTSLQTALAQGCDHLSVYDLSIEPSSFWYRFQPQLPSHNHTYAQYQLLTTTLKEAGWDHYALSAYARNTEHRCCHNLGYWQERDYIGFGPSAASKLGAWRCTATKRWLAYCNWRQNPAHLHAFEERLTPQIQALEALMLYLRCSDGIDRKTYLTKHGRWGVQALERLQTVPNPRWVNIDTTLHLTEQGMRFYDAIAAHCFMDACP